MKYIKLFEEYSTESLSYLLNDNVDMIGVETKKKLSNDIILYKNKYGSYRFVKYIDNIPVSAIQIMYNYENNPIIANVYTLPEYRQQSLAKNLFYVAQDYFGQKIEHSQYLSDLGTYFKNSTNN